MDKKYGPIKFKWTWTSDFMEWKERYEQDKADYFYKDHVAKTSKAKLENAELIKLFPKELLEKFGKETLVDKKKQEAEDLKVPPDVVAKGVKAIDEWIEQARKIKK